VAVRASGALTQPAGGAGLRPRPQASVTDVYLKFEAPQSTAAEEATALLAAVEGAVVLARARRTTQPLDAVEQHFKTPVAPTATCGPAVGAIRNCRG
jgi:hypothetical protein